jgi:hypothetical protein
VTDLVTKCGDIIHVGQCEARWRQIEQEVNPQDMSTALYGSEDGPPEVVLCQMIQQTAYELWICECRIDVQRHNLGRWNVPACDNQGKTVGHVSDGIYDWVIIPCDPKAHLSLLSMIFD